MTKSAEELRRELKVTGEVLLSGYTTVEKLSFYALDLDNSVYDAELVLASGRGDMPRISIRFGRVTNLELKSFGGGLTQITGLYIREISARGWEYQKFEVGDFENSAFSLRCHRVTIAGVAIA